MAYIRINIYLLSAIVAFTFVTKVSAQIQPETSILSGVNKGPNIPENIMQDIKSITDTTQLNSFIQNTMATHHIPGLSACIIKESEVVWLNTYGYADFAQDDIEVADTTLFMIGSISKTFVATAAMQLWENGLLDLDANINDYLPFSVVNPYYPAHSITMRMLLSHASSLARNDQVWFNLVHWGADSPIPLGTFLEDYLVPGGQYYNPTNFLQSAPGTQRQYCNYAFAMAGYIIEILSGMPFEQYCQDEIFIPLGMDETSWFLANLDEGNIAIPYDWTGSMHEPYYHYGVPVYPCGQLRTSVPQLAQHLISFMSFSKFHEINILDSSTIDLMRKDQFPEIPDQGNVEVGIAWMTINIDDSTYLCGHDGVMWGYQSAMYFDPDRNTAIIALINLFEIGDPGFGYIVQALLEFSYDYDNDGIVAGYDNCFNTYNPEQADWDEDGAGDLCDYVCGDVNTDNIVDILDIVLLIDNKFKEGPLPYPEAAADVNNDEAFDILDIVFLIDNKFKDGPDPVCL